MLLDDDIGMLWELREHKEEMILELRKMERQINELELLNKKQEGEIRRDGNDNVHDLKITELESKIEKLTHENGLLCDRCNTTLNNFNAAQKEKVFFYILFYFIQKYNA